MDRLNRMFCSNKCKYEYRKTQPKLPKLKTTKIATRAQRRIRYLVEIGKIKIPELCEECNKKKKLEAAHYNYNEPENVRWLCVSCHRKWDINEPKGGVVYREEFTGKKAKKI